MHGLEQLLRLIASKEIGGTTSFFYLSFFFHPSFYFQVILPSFFKEKPSFFLSILPSFIMYTSFFFLFSVYNLLFSLFPSFFMYLTLFFYIFPSFLSKMRFSPQYFCPCSFHAPTRCTVVEINRRGDRLGSFGCRELIFAYSDILKKS